MITLNVSMGEAFDKHTILKLKQSKIINNDKLVDINKELDSICINNVIDKYRYLYDLLYRINKDIWELTDKVKEKADIDIYNEIFLKNEARFRVKSKINKLTTSFLQEQKSYSTSSLTLYLTDSNKHPYIRYLSLCYDVLIIKCNFNILSKIQLLFVDDPHIIVEEGSDGIDVNNLNNEPIPNLFNSYNFDNIPINFISGGKMGDFIHTLYVIKCMYEVTGRKGNLFITGDNVKYGGDIFTFTVERAYNELSNIINNQSYINLFKIHNNEEFDINLNKFRQYPNIFRESWLEIMAHTFNTPVIELPWITIPKNNDSKYKDKVLIHRSLVRHMPNFEPILEKIIKNNSCLFITCNIKEYEAFPLKHLLEVELKESLDDIYHAINDCQFFIGNQSSPLAMAYSLFKPLLCEAPEDYFYSRKKHYPGVNWFSSHSFNFDTLTNYIQL